MRVLSYDCRGGVSGDMNLAALLDLGVPEDHLRAELARLGIGGYRLVRSRERRRTVTGTRIGVVLDDHDHAHRGLSDIRDIIASSALAGAVKERSIAVFMTLARAEARVHGAGLSEVRFHEVGGIDAIVEVVGAAVCLDWIGAEEILCGPVELGSGTVRCAHGLFPVPAPATAEILSARGIPVTAGGLPFEAATPTGAAFLATCVDRFARRGDVTVEREGYGLGSREADTPAALRVFLGTAPDVGDSPTCTPRGSDPSPRSRMC